MAVYDVYIMTMVRKQIYIKQEQDRKLKKLAANLGITEAEVVRRAIDELESPAGASYPESLAALFEIARRRRETLPLSNGGRTWTRDELYDERPKYLSR